MPSESYMAKESKAKTGTLQIEKDSFLIIWDIP